MTSRAARAQLHRFASVLRERGYDARESGGEDALSYTRVTRVVVHGEKESGIAIDEPRRYTSSVQVWFLAHPELDRWFANVDDGIRYYARTLRSLRPRMSLRTRDYPHYGEGDPLPLPNPHDAACWVDEARSNPGDFTTPPTDRAFAAEDHLPKVREKLYAQRDSFGELRGVRLDIPSRMRDLMVVTIHEKPSGGTVVGYDHSAVVKNAEFRVAQGQQAKIMRGEAKAPHAYVSGTLVNEVPTTKGTPISFNPRTTHLFLDATNGRPVKAAKRVSIIGKRVYAEGLAYFAPGEAPKRPV